MKNILCFILTIFFLSYTTQIAIPQNTQLKINNQTNLNLDLNKNVITNPENLKIWYPPPVENPFLPKSNYSGGTIVQPPSSISTYRKTRPWLKASGISLPVIVGGFMISLATKKTNNYILIPPIINSSKQEVDNQVISEASVIPIDEERLLSLTINDAKSIPLEKEGKLYIKLSDKFAYKDNSTFLNAVNLTDNIDTDILFYDKLNHTLIFDITNKEKNYPINISFNVIINNSSIELNSQYCLVKYTNKDNFFNVEWSKISISDE